MRENGSGVSAGLERRDARPLRNAETIAERPLLYAEAHLRNGEGALPLSSSGEQPEKFRLIAGGYFSFEKRILQTGHFCAMVSPSSNPYPIVRAIARSPSIAMSQSNSIVS